MINKLHQINALGIREVSFGEIRVEKLENRMNPKVPFPHKHDFFQLLLITEGTGWHKIDFKKHKVREGQFFFMKPGQVHTWDLSQTVKGIVIEFSRVSMSKDLTQTIDLIPDSLFFKKKFDFDKMYTLAELMLTEFQLQNDQFETCIKKFLAVFIILINRKINEGSVRKVPNPKGKINQVEELRKLIEMNYKKEHGVQFYAEALGTTPKTLTMFITRAIGKSPRTLIQERILLEAKRFLGYSELRMAEIGYELGFEDPNYFSRFFRLHFKETAGEFRKKLKPR